MPKQTKHNLKLPAAFKSKFTPPYEQYLANLLERTRHLDPQSIGKTRISMIEKTAPRGTGWTVWISSDLKREFMERKQAIGAITHSVFLEILMALDKDSGSDNNSTSSSPSKKVPDWLADIIHIEE